MVREWCVLYILTWKCASRHNGVQFFISHLASWLRTRRFSEPTFRPSRATNHWKNTVNRDFPTFSRICIFFLLIFSLLTLLTSAFQLSILSEVSLLNFLRPYIPYMDPMGYTVIKSTRYNASGIEQPTCEYLKSMEITQSSCRTFFDSLCIHLDSNSLPSGNLLHSYWKWPFIVSFPIKHGGSFHSYVNVYQRVLYSLHITHRIHGAAIYGNMDPINIPQSC